MAFNIGAVVSVQGEREFNAAMNSMKQNMKYVSAEANAAMSVFAENEKSVESLTAKNDGLKKALDLQRQGINNIRATMDKFVTDGLDPTSEKYKQLKANLDNTTAAANKTEQEIKENEGAIIGLEQAMSKNEQAMERSKDAMGGLGQESQGLGSVVQGVANKFGVTLPDGLTKSMDGFGGLDAKMLAIVGTCAAASAAVYKVTEALAEMTIEVAASMDDIATNSVIMGISTEQYQKFLFMSELVDVSVDTLGSSMSKMIRSMSAARKGTGDAAQAFKELGVRIADGSGHLRDQNEVFNEVIDKLRGMSNETERDAMSMAIFGRSARDLNPLIETSAERVAELEESFRKMKYAATEEAEAALLNLDDNLREFDNQVTATKKNIAAEFAPSLTLLVESAANVVASLGNLIEESGIIDVFAALMDIVRALSPIFEVLFDTLGTGSSGPLKALALALAIVADALTIVINLVAMAIEGVRQLFKLLSGDADTTKLDQYAKNLNNVFSSGGATAKALGLGQGTTSTGYTSGGGGMSLVSANGVSLASGPRGINTQAGLVAYEKRLATDQRLADGQRMYGTAFYDYSQNTFKVDDIETYAAIEKRMKSERQSTRMGYVGR